MLTSISVKKTEILKLYSKIWVFSPSGSKDVNFSIKLFLAFILSNITQNFDVFISERSIITFEDKIFKTPGEPYHIIEDPV